ncbi:MAG: poly(3-hydroxyalkanoate) depolymerase [Burkholderiaceae bacterium]
MSTAALPLPAMPRTAARPTPANAAPPFHIEMLRIGSQLLRVGRQHGDGEGPPLLLFNGIGANIELLEPLARAMSGREILTFDVPGVGHSPLPSLPYRLTGIARLATGVLDHYGHARCDVLGISWGGGAAQQFARTHADRCRRLVLCATAPGVAMVPAHPRVLMKMATPQRYVSKSYAQRVAGDIYGGDFRGNPALGAEMHKHVRWQSRLGYYLQLAAMSGWTSIHWLHRLRMPTLIMAGVDDPLIPLINPRLMRRLIPNAELKVFDCGHLFLLTRVAESAATIDEFLNRP